MDAAGTDYSSFAPACARGYALILPAPCLLIKLCLYVYLHCRGCRLKRCSLASMLGGYSNWGVGGGDSLNGRRMVHDLTARGVYCRSHQCRTIIGTKGKACVLDGLIEPSIIPFAMHRQLSPYWKLIHRDPFAGHVGVSKLTCRLKQCRSSICLTDSA